MEGFFMNGLWKKRVPAFLLTLVMIVSLMPAALAAPEGNPDASNVTAVGGNTTGDPTTGTDNDNSNQPETPAVHDHSWDSGSVVKPATCKDEGLRVYACTVAGCKETKDETIPATGAHDWKVISTTANCGRPGTKTEECFVCKEEKTSNDPATNNHNWQDSGAPTLAATCGEEGVQPQVCQVCGQTQDKKIPATGKHTWKTTVVTPATCTGAGAKYDVCEVCREKTEPVTIPMLGHTAPDANGKCTRCKELIQAHTHTPGSWQKNATMHWRVCTTTTCQAKLDESAHNYNLSNNTTCVCGALKPLNTVVVRFLNGGTVVSTQNVEVNKAPTVPANPAKGAGYVFKGWVAYNPGNALWTTATAVASPGATPVAKATDYYAIYSVSGNAISSTIDATTNIGGLI